MAKKGKGSKPNQMPKGKKNIIVTAEELKAERMRAQRAERRKTQPLLGQSGCGAWGNATTENKRGRQSANQDSKRYKDEWNSRRNSDSGGNSKSADYDSL